MKYITITEDGVQIKDRLVGRREGGREGRVRLWGLSGKGRERRSICGEENMRKMRCSHNSLWIPHSITLPGLVDVTIQLKNFLEKG